MKTEKKRQEEKEQATRWAESAGIMEVEDPQVTVTYGELAGILYRTLEYFFDGLVAAEEDC